jgi:hypothetical protein
VVGLLWTSDQPVAKVCVYTGQHNTEKQRQTSMPQVRLEPMIPKTKRPRPTTEIMLPPEQASLNLLPCNFGHYDIYTVWHDIAFHNFENMLYDHKQVKMQIHIGLEVFIFWGTSTSTLYVACAEGLPVKNFLVMIVLGYGGYSAMGEEGNTYDLSWFVPQFGCGEWFHIVDRKWIHKWRICTHAHVLIFFTSCNTWFLKHEWPLL